MGTSCNIMTMPNPPQRIAISISHDIFVNLQVLQDASEPGGL